MPEIKNPLDIYKFLPKTNCKKCCFPTCLAFANAVFKGQNSLKECPALEDSVIKQLEGNIVKPLTIEQQQELVLESLKKEIAAIEFSPSLAQKLGAAFSEGKLIIKVLGKNFVVDAEGNITSDCHVITWVTVPLLNYIKFCRGAEVTGKWVPFRELENGKVREPLFVKGCELPLKEIADTHTDLFEYMISVFGAEPEENPYSSDILLVLNFLPRLPVLINYCGPEEGRQTSRLNIFFDSSAVDNLNLESIHMLCSGFVTMIEKITRRHT